MSKNNPIVICRPREHFGVKSARKAFIYDKNEIDFGQTAEQPPDNPSIKILVTDQTQDAFAPLLANGPARFRA